MSRTVAMRCGKRAFWSYDESVSILLHLLAEAAENSPIMDVEEIRNGREVAVVGASFGLDLGDEWSNERRTRVIELLDVVCDELERRGELGGDEVATWAPLPRVSTSSGAERQGSGAPPRQSSSSAVRWLNWFEATCPSRHRITGGIHR